MNIPRAIFEALVLVGILYVVGGWIEMEWNPREWHVLTRIIMVLVVVLLVGMASKPGVGAPPK